MELAEKKRQWKTFNQAVNDLARCVKCKQLFEHEIYMCTDAHNICHRCYNIELTGRACFVKTCKGVYMEQLNRNLLLTELSQLRFNLYAARKSLDRWQELPWIELLQCAICFSVMDRGVFMCQFGHNWCATCQRQLVNNKKCSFCNVVLSGTRKNVTIQDILSRMRKFEIHNPLRRTGRFECPIDNCWEQCTMHVMYAHLSSDHPELYFQLGEFECDDQEYHKVATIRPQNFTAGIKIQRKGLFGIVVNFIEGRKGWKYVDEAYVYCLSATRMQYYYVLRLEFTSKKYQSARCYHSGEVSITDTHESAKQRFDEKSIAREHRTSCSPIRRDSEVSIYIQVTRDPRLINLFE